MPLLILNMQTGSLVNAQEKLNFVKKKKQVQQVTDASLFSSENMGSKWGKWLISLSFSIILSEGRALKDSADLMLGSGLDTW